MTYTERLREYEKPMGKPELTYRAKAEGTQWSELEKIVNNPIQKARNWAMQQNKPWPPVRFWDQEGGEG